MLHSHSFVTLPALLAAGLLGTACSATNGPLIDNPFLTGPGRAVVTGVVRDAAGGVVTGTTVRIGCAGGDEVVVPTDSTGRYITGLNISADTFDLTAAHPSCRFSEPDSGTIRAQVDTALIFARGPVLVILQTVDLRER